MVFYIQENCTCNRYTFTLATCALSTFVLAIFVPTRKLLIWVWPILKEMYQNFHVSLHICGMVWDKDWKLLDLSRYLKRITEVYRNYYIIHFWNKVIFELHQKEIFHLSCVIFTRRMNHERKIFVTFYCQVVRLISVTIPPDARTFVTYEQLIAYFFTNNGSKIDFYIWCNIGGQNLPWK